MPINARFLCLAAAILCAATVAAQEPEQGSVSIGRWETVARDNFRMSPADIRGGGMHRDYPHVDVDIAWHAAVRLAMQQGVFLHVSREDGLLGVASVTSLELPVRITIEPTPEPPEKKPSRRQQRKEKKKQKKAAKRAKREARKNKSDDAVPATETEDEQAETQVAATDPAVEQSAPDEVVVDESPGTEEQEAVAEEPEELPPLPALVTAGFPLVVLIDAHEDRVVRVTVDWPAELLAAVEIDGRRIELLPERREALATQFFDLYATEVYGHRNWNYLTSH